MRIVHWKEEAEKICAIREGWSFKAVRRKKTQAIDWNNFEEAPFQEKIMEAIESKKQIQLCFDPKWKYVKAVETEIGRAHV